MSLIFRFVFHVLDFHNNILNKIDIVCCIWCFFCVLILYLSRIKWKYLGLLYFLFIDDKYVNNYTQLYY